MDDLQLESPALAEELGSAALPATANESCPACGAPVDGDDRFCNACGRGLATRQTPQSNLGPSRRLQCESCGAEIATQADQRSYTCLFCDSNYVVELPEDASTKEPPEFVIGFAITQEQALAKYRGWIAENSWFRPRDLGKVKVTEKLRGVYLPFWTFSMLSESRWSASIGEYWYRTETYTTIQNGKTVTRTRRVQETEWWDLSGRFHRYRHGFLVSGSKGLPHDQAGRIKPFHLAALKRYEPLYLAGWSCEDYSVEKEAALRICEEEFRSRERNDIAAFLPGDTHRGLDTDTKFSRVNSDLVLLPIYLLTYRYKDKLYRFLINGQTGRVAGDKPVAWGKVAAVVLSIAAALAAIVAAIALLSR